ncbi:transporter [Anaerobacillus arseniciselenatis]|uniref:Transporter n=1 Tax=Anaerobacillus arseniciselenatis TaxID=85682 RepID=A0A1S2LTM7_9BACI|nr:AEC family transporter [Anaerobacillus arseniciselenatis]OIJ14725.1 transporter [Anaerobacillus arseniciselenatis]
MAVLLLILQNIIVPVFVLIFAGILLHRKFKLDLNSLSKITFYYLIPAVIFVKIYQSDISIDLVSSILYFLLLQAASLLIVTSLIARIFRFEKKLVASFKNSVLLNNQGNYGLPVNALVFRNDPFAMSIQIIIMTFQNLLTFTYGIFNVQKGEKNKGILKQLTGFLKTPVLHALMLALIIKSLNITIPDMIWIPLEQASDGFLAIALLTLGAQVAYLKINSYILPIIVSSFTRLVVSPVIAFVLILLLGIEGITAQTLFIASSFPTSRNSAAIALEYNYHPEFAAQIVLVTTVLSIFTVTGTVYLANVLF